MKVLLAVAATTDRLLQEVTFCSFEERY